MAKILITIAGVDYPCYFTLGAGLFFKQETGKDVSKMDKSDLTELGTLLFAQCKAAALREKIDFPYSLEEFLVWVTDEDLYALGEEQKKDSKKNKTPGNRRQ